MNWLAMLYLTAALGASCLGALIGIWMIDKKGVHPAWFMVGIFVAALLFVGIPWDRIP